MKKDFSDFKDLKALTDHPVSGQIDTLFRSVIKENKSKPNALEAVAPQESGVSMSSNDKELPLDEMGEFEIDLGGETESSQESPLEAGLDLGFSEDVSLDLAADENEFIESSEEQEGYGDLSLEDEEELSLSEDEYGDEEELETSEGIENLGELSFDDAPDLPSEDELSLSDMELGGDEELSLGDSLTEDDSLDLGGEELDLSEASSEDAMELGAADELSLSEDEEFSLGGDSLSFEADESLDLGGDGDLSEDAIEKLKEIDAILDLDASKIHLSTEGLTPEVVDNLDEPLVSDDLDLGSLNFSSEDSADEEEAFQLKEEKPKKKKKEVSEAKDRDIGEDLKEISGAYSGEMERMQATISNLRADREELLNKIQKFEDDKMMGGRNALTLRAELDEKKIELTIMRKKLNEEIGDLRDRLKLFDEKRLILEEKNRILTQELDKTAQKNKFDVKKVQMRERELEQKLELLKSDAETQIRHRDLKILELKRKIDAMEFDMESISMQEKRSVESRYELEDKLDKAIKTLRGAITVLEDESDRSNALSALKKNIDM